MNGRARKGGERGVNGEVYKGGQFLPASQQTVKGLHTAGKMTGCKQVLIEPGKVVTVERGKRAIFDRIKHFVGNVDGFLRITASAHAIEHYGLTNELPELVERYNKGERFI